MGEEKRFENKVKKYLKEQGAWFVKMWGGGLYTKNGTPDILACVNGVFVAIEVKAENGTPSDLQEYNIRKINGSGGIGIILYPSGYQDFVKIIEGVKNCNSHTAELTHLKNAHTNSNCVILTN